MAPHTKVAAPSSSTHVSIPLQACAICRRVIEESAEPQQAEPQSKLLTNFWASNELAGALRAASSDYELSGAVTPETMNRMRQLLGAVDA